MNKVKKIPNRAYKAHIERYKRYLKEWADYSGREEYFEYFKYMCHPNPETLRSEIFMRLNEQPKSKKKW